MKKKRYLSPAMVVVALNQKVGLLVVSGVKSGSKAIRYGGEDTDGSIDPA